MAVLAWLALQLGRSSFGRERVSRRAEGGSDPATADPEVGVLDGLWEAGGSALKTPVEGGLVLLRREGDESVHLVGNLKKTTKRTEIIQLLQEWEKGGREEGREWEGNAPCLCCPRIISFCFRS